MFLPDYQNIFTRVQLTVPADMGVGDRDTMDERAGKPFASYWIGKFGNAQLGRSIWARSA